MVPWNMNRYCFPKTKRGIVHFSHKKSVSLSSAAWDSCRQGNDSPFPPPVPGGRLQAVAAGAAQASGAKGGLGDCCC